MASPTEFATELSAMEKRVKLLQHVVYVPEMATEVARILANLPNPDPNYKAPKGAPKPTIANLPTFESLGRKEKIKILMVRARANLLMPVFSAEAEGDLNRALKLDQSSAEPLVLLSECLWRKNALREAVDAIESALRLKPDASPALCQQSRLLRSLVSAETDKAASLENASGAGTPPTNTSFATAPSNNNNTSANSAAFLSNFSSPVAAIAAAALAKDAAAVGAPQSEQQQSTPLLAPSRGAVMSEEERRAMTEKAIEKAREAVKLDPMGSEAWQALGMALLFDNITNGMDMPNLKKALGAFNQAIQNNAAEIAKIQQKHADAGNNSKSSDPFLKLVQHNPDNFYNRAVVLECFAQFGAAASDYETAARLDPAGLRAGIAKAKTCVDIVRKFKALTSDSVVVAAAEGSAATTLPVTVSATTTKEKDITKKLGSGLAAKRAGAKDVSGPVLLSEVLDKPVVGAADATKSKATVSLLVADCLTAPTAQPLVYLCTDQHRNACALLIYRVNAQAILKGDVVSVGFPPSSAYTLVQNIGELSVRMPTVRFQSGANPFFVTVSVAIPPC